jgi:hypothetical protein
MENLLGWFFLLIIFIFIFVWTIKYRYLRNLLLIAFLLRAICVLFDYYDIIILPDSRGDTSHFDESAIEFSKNYGLLIIFDFFKDSLLISKIISIFYTIFGYSKLMAQSISVALGTASVYLVYHLCLMIWDYSSAKKAAWATALFPTLILYSSLILREVYIVFFLLVGVIGIAKFIDKKNITSLLQILVSFFILSFFHGPVAIGVFIFLFYEILSLSKKVLNRFYYLRINLFSVFSIIALSIPIVMLLSNNISINYLPSLFNISAITYKANLGMYGTASYPSWLMINNSYELFTKNIIKSFYFLYGPFIWDIKLLRHLIGLLDGILYFILTFYIIKNWYAIWANPITRIIVLLLITYIIVYGLGVGNFGTGIRHRSKFAVLLIILAAPKIHKFIFSTKKKLYNR